MARNSNHSNLIGSHLSGKNENNPTQNQPGIKQTIYISEEDGEHQSWGQTTKDWRKLREKIRHLQHDISKHERIEKQFKEEIEALKNTNEKLQLEINKRTQTEDTDRQQINQQTEQSSNNETIISDYLQSQSSEKLNNSLETTPKDRF